MHTKIRHFSVCKMMNLEFKRRNNIKKMYGILCNSICHLKTKKKEFTFNTSKPTWKHSWKKERKQKNKKEYEH